MSFYKDGPQLVDHSDPFFVTTINASEFADISKLNHVYKSNEMCIYSMVDNNINNTDHPNGFPISNHKNWKYWENTNNQEWKETTVNFCHKYANRKETLVDHERWNY